MVEVEVAVHLGNKLERDNVAAVVDAAGMRLRSYGGGETVSVTVVPAVSQSID